MQKCLNFQAKNHDKEKQHNKKQHRAIDHSNEQ
jgi:hypothetical protein